MPQSDNPMRKATAIEALPKVSKRGLETVLRNHQAATGLRATRIGLVSSDFQVLELELTRKVDAAKTLTMANPAGGSVIISVWTSGVSSGQAALSGFGEE